jgi:hypothetical protein
MRGIIGGGGNRGFAAVPYGDGEEVEETAPIPPYRRVGSRVENLSMRELDTVLDNELDVRSSGEITPKLRISGIKWDKIRCGRLTRENDITEGLA